MAVSRLSGVRLAGLASAVPEETLTVADDAISFGDADARKISESTGVSKRRVVSNGLCTSDLCLAAGERLLAELGWERDSVDALIFVSQTPDYLLPATSCSLHGRLNLSTRCAAFDINLGCSGYIYGLWMASNLIACGSVRRVLLLVGDTISRIVSPRDRATAPLFGDAGTATALESDDDAPSMVFELGTDGTGQEHLIVPAGAFRQPRTEQTPQRTEREGGNVRSDEDLFMNGAEIFAFTLRVVPKLIKSVTDAAGWSTADVDAWVMHQANRFMLQHLIKRMKLPAEKAVLAIEDYGNTSSASIPLAMTHSLSERLTKEKLNLVMVGFGVGFSWGAVALTCKNVVMPGLLIVPSQAV
ncbi:MAG TPA: ketoacyl-ACP synthase III [Blastocatellia bacterium]|nr:ketoacyl-ACP synthase III [Blastocatellia bacterium]